MRKNVFLGAVALIVIIGADPAFCFQATPLAGEATQPDSADLSTPIVPPVEDPSQPTPAITEPLPPEMPPVVNSDVPVGLMATLPLLGRSALKATERRAR